MIDDFFYENIGELEYLIELEYKRQRKKYGKKFCDGLSPETWALILAEETGEVADAVIKLTRKDRKSAPKSVLVNRAKEECIHVAATAISTYLAIMKWERENNE